MTIKKREQVGGHPPPRKKMVCYRVTWEEYDRLVAFAKERGLSYVGVIDLALHSYLDREEKKKK